MPDPAQHSPRSEETFDVIVLGAGAAGAAAALAARAGGAEVVVLEKCDPSQAGGNTRVSGGGWFTHADPERAAVFLRNLCGAYPVADDVIDTWAHETARNSAWLRSLGAEVSMNPAYHTEPEYAELPGADCCTGMDTVGGQMGNFLLYDFLTRAMTEAGVEVRHSARAVRLMTQDGRVTGVVTQSGDQLCARGGVVLATGGFAANPELVRDYLQVTDAVNWGSPHTTGDGLALAQRVGADLWHMVNMMSITGVRDERGGGHYLALWHGGSHIFVNDAGRRFVDESARNRHGQVMRDGRPELFPTRDFWLIFDERLRTAGPLSPGPEVLPVGWQLLMNQARWSDDNSAEIDRGLIVQADSIGELAASITMDPATLERTVAAFNLACEQGRDDQFGRTPRTLEPIAQGPFHALRVTPLLGWSNGGPRRDGRARVLDPDRRPIEGLYAAGEVSSTYSWAKDGGFHIADALAFGRVAGGEAAQRAQIDTTSDGDAGPRTVPWACRGACVR